MLVIIILKISIDDFDIMVDPDPKYPTSSNIDQAGLLNGSQDGNGDDRVMNTLLDSGSDKSDRMGFIRKVYGIISAQLSLTACACAYVQIDHDANEFMK